MSSDSHTMVSRFAMHTAPVDTPLPTSALGPLDDAFHLAGVVAGSEFIGPHAVKEYAPLRWLTTDDAGPPLRVGDRFAMVLLGTWRGTGDPVLGAFPEVELIAVNGIRLVDRLGPRWYLPPGAT